MAGCVEPATCAVPVGAGKPSQREVSLALCATPQRHVTPFVSRQVACRIEKTINYLSRAEPHLLNGIITSVNTTTR